MRRWLLVIPLCLLSGSALAGVWADMWSTHDQQGQRLLEAGHARQAARRFSDPRHRAYAQIRSHQYAQAIRLLAPYRDVTSMYNRANALAYSGELRDALADYNAALAQAPGNRDIRHNRDLVARALQRQQARSGSGQRGQRRSGASQSGQPRPQQAARAGAKQGGGRSGNAGQPSGQAQAARNGASPSSADSASARADAQFAAQQLARERQNPGQRSGRGARVSDSSTSRGRSGRSATSRGSPLADLFGDQPESEQQLALKQWLRRVPDDPGGLLRRKFLLDYMRRQRQDEQQP